MGWLQALEPTSPWHVILWLRKSSVKFIQAFANIGLIPDSGGTYWLPRLVGMARAKALTMLGTPIVASEAQAMGLIHQAVDEEDFEDAVNALASNWPTCLHAAWA